LFATFKWWTSAQCRRCLSRWRIWRNVSYFKILRFLTRRWGPSSWWKRHCGCRGSIPGTFISRAFKVRF